MKPVAHTKEMKERRSRRTIRTVSELARELNRAASRAEAAEMALRALFRLIPVECARLTKTLGEDRQQLYASLEEKGEFTELEETAEVMRVSHTMLERAVQRSEPVSFNHATSELVSRALLIQLVCQSAQSILCAPLLVGENLLGMMIASTPDEAAYTEDDLAAVGAVASLLAATLTRLELSTGTTRALEREQARERDEALIESLRSAVQSSSDLERVVQHTIDALGHSLPASFVLLRLASFGLPEDTLRAWTPQHSDRPLLIHGPAGRSERAVYTEQRPIFIEDVRSECAGSAEMRNLEERLGARSIYFTPVIYGGRVLASLGLVEADAQRRWTPTEQSLLARVAETIAPLITNTQLHTRLRSYVEDLLMLLKLAGDALGEVELDRCFRALLDSWARTAGTDAAAILRWDEEHRLLRLAATKNLPTGLLERYTQGVSLDDPVCGLAATRRVGVVADLASEPRFASLYTSARWSGLRSAWATPVTGATGKLLGVLVCFSRVVSEASADEQRLADLFARPIAVALEKNAAVREARVCAQTIRQLETDLKQSERHKAEFMSIISHELRTPLNAIIGYAQMLKEGFSGELNEQQASDVKTIAESADRLLSMVEDTLDLARIDAERFPIYMDTVAFEDVAKRAISTVRGVAEMKGLDIRLRISEDAPVVRTDPERVRQILTNLLANAVKFTERGSVEVRVIRGDEGYAQINVIDTGIGFDTEAFPQVFEEFRQADTSNTRVYGGTGLGLAVSKRLVQRLGGEIGVQSTPGEGSLFWFSLPPELPGEEV